MEVFLWPILRCNVTVCLGYRWDQRSKTSMFYIWRHIKNLTILIIWPRMLLISSAIVSILNQSKYRTALGLQSFKSVGRARMAFCKTRQGGRPETCGAFREPKAEAAASSQRRRFPPSSHFTRPKQARCRLLNTRYTTHEITTPYEGFSEVEEKEGRDA